MTWESQKVSRFIRPLSKVAQEANIFTETNHKLGRSSRVAVFMSNYPFWHGHFSDTAAWESPMFLGEHR